MTARAVTFAEQVGQQRDELRDRLAALDYVAEVVRGAEGEILNAKDRERGGMVFDPVDPTRVILPLVWLRALLQYERVRGYGIISASAEMTALLAEWNAKYHSTGTPKFERLEAEHPQLARALAEFMATL